MIFTSRLRNYKLAVLAVIFCSLCMLIVGGKAHANNGSISFQGMGNELPMPSTAFNYVPDASQPFGIKPIGNTGYLVVGTGAFDVKLFIVTYEAPTNAQFDITILHANICRTALVDDPDNGLNPVTTFTAIVPNFTHVTEGSSIQTGRSCSNVDQTLTVYPAQLKALSNGKYGGVFLASLKTDNSATASQQNSFQLRAPNGIILGYNREAADLAINSFLGIANNPPPGAYDTDWFILNSTSPGWDTSVRNTVGNQSSVNITNTALPYNGVTDFSLPFTPNCDLLNNQTLLGSQLAINFYDADDFTGGGTLQGTNGHPQLWFYLDRRPNGSPNAWPTTVYSRRLIGGNHQTDNISDLPDMQYGYTYTARISGLSRPNALQFSVGLDPSLDLLNSPSKDCRNDRPPTCSITVANAGSIYPGDTIQFTAHTTYASGYAIGVNGPTAEDAGRGAWPNYLVSGNQYARGSPVGIGNGTNQDFAITSNNPTDTPYDDMVFVAPPGGANVTSMIAPSTPGTYNFNWGLVWPNYAWASAECVSTITVQLPDLCTNIPGLQNPIPAFPFSVSGTTCTQPDNAPVITITPTCDNTTAAGSYYVTITTTDPDAGGPTPFTPGGTPTVSYSGTGIPANSQTSSSFTVNIDPKIAVTVTASTNGVYPYYPDPSSYKSASVTAGPFGPCIYSFKLVPTSQTPVLSPDYEMPLQVDSATYVTAYTPGHPTNGVKGVNDDEQLYVVKGGVQQPYLKRVNSAKNFTATVTDTYGPYSLVGLNLVAGDAVCTFHSIANGQGWVDVNGNTINNTTYPLGGQVDGGVQCSFIVDEPYLRAYGGDVIAGAGFENTCTASPVPAGIKAFARKITTPFAGYVGAGSQLAVFADSTIDHFSSATMSDALGASALAKARTFSNKNGADEYGSSFASGFCAPSYWVNDLPASSGGGAVDLNNATNGTPTQYSAGVTFKGNNIVKRVAAYVDGDATIINDITTKPSGWASVNTIPSVYVIVRGNIYIRPKVHQLDGVYIAMPKLDLSGNPVAGTGRIVTCAPTDVIDLPNPTTLLDTTAAGCKSKLTINGAFLAQHVSFFRTNGTLRNATIVDTTPPPTCSGVSLYQDISYYVPAGLSPFVVPSSSAETDYATMPPAIGPLVLSSMRVPAGCEVIIYQGSNFTGASKTLYGDWNIYGATDPWNDKTISMKVIPVSTDIHQIGIVYTYNGISPAMSANDDCTKVDVPSDTYWTGAANDNYICVPKGSVPGLQFSSSGVIPGKTCVNIHESADINGWNNNTTFLCSNSDMGFQYTENGVAAIGIPGMYCAVIWEPGDAHIPQTWWQDNYICEPAKTLTTPPSLAGEPASSTNIAEVFQFTPDLILQKPATDPISTLGTYQSIVSLPPAL